MGTHYETLGVKPSASTKEIRKAYLRRARALHPDRQLDRSEADARRAEEAMQVVNAAWDVLSDPKKKAEYDQRIKGSRPVAPRAPQQRPPQQRPAQPRTASSGAAYQQQARASSTSSSTSSQGPGGIGNILVSIPVLILIGVLVGVIIVAVLFNSDSPNGPVLIDNELAVQDCFVLVGNEPREVACDTGQADGQVTSVGPDRGNCPESSQLPLRDPDSDFYLCWARMIPGSSNTIP